MLRLILILCLLIPGALFAQTLTTAQYNLVRQAIIAEPTLATALANRDDRAITEWCNSASTTDAWLAAADAKTQFEAMDLTKFDALTAGKRAAWDLMLRNAPLDFGRNKLRSAVVDVWGNTDSIPAWKIELGAPT